MFNLVCGSMIRTPLFVYVMSRPVTSQSNNGNPTIQQVPDQPIRPESKGFLSTVGDWIQQGFDDLGLSDLWDDWTGKTESRWAAEENLKLQKDAQEYQTSERLDQNEWELQNHMRQLLEDPTLQAQGLKAIGMSDSAIAQTLMGSQGNFGIGAASNGGSPLASVSPVPPTNSILSAIQGFAKLKPDIDKTLSEIGLNKSQGLINAQVIKESDARINKLAHDMNIDDQTTDISRQLMESTKGLQYTEALVNLGKLDEIQETVTNLIHERDVLDSNKKFLDAHAAHEWALKTLTDSQNEYQQQVNNNGTADAIKANYQNQAYAAGESGDLAHQQALGEELDNFGRKLRADVAKNLGVEPGADVVTGCLELMAQGKTKQATKLVNMSLKYDEYQYHKEAWKGFASTLPFGFGKLFKR